MTPSQMHPPEVTIFTDGSSLGNPGPGGWGAILVWGEKCKELFAGYKKTTNNRMELRAVLHALEDLKRPCTVHVYSDSRYVCDAIEQHWLRNWERGGWRTSAKKPVKNRDLWERLRIQLNKHAVRFFWVKGHAGHPENERCDELARQAASQPDLPPDEGYETT